MQFYQPAQLQFLWLVPGIICLLLLAAKSKEKLLNQLGNINSVRMLLTSHSTSKVRWKNILLTLAVLCLVIALAQPQWGEEKKKLKRKGIDLIFLVDISLSMLAEDVKPSRIEKAKFEMKSFLKHLKGDRVGIVTFAGTGFLQSPLTLDYSAFSLFADSIEVGYIPDLGTSLSEGIQTAIHSLSDDKSKYRAVIILSDGENMEENTDIAVWITLAKSIAVKKPKK